MLEILNQEVETPEVPEEFLGGEGEEGEKVE